LGQGQTEMKRFFPDANLWLTVPLIVLLLIGIAGFWVPIYLPPIAALAKNGINEQWLGFVGNIVGALVTLLAAGLAWFAVQRQINAQADIANKARKRMEFAARGILPLSLSALYLYAERCIETLDTLPDPVPRGTELQLPELPVQDVQEIRDALEHMEETSALGLVNTLQFLQIQHARIRPFKQKAFDGSLMQYEIQRRLIDALDLAALIDRSFIYARGSDFKAPQSTADELERLILLHGVADAQPWIQIELKRRRATDTADLTTPTI
jgi:hypothetical protein